MRGIFFISIIFLLLSSSIVRAETTVSLVVDINEDIGAQVSLVECVFDQLPEKLNVVEIPWKRGQIATENGSVDGFFIAARAAQRDKYATYSAPLREISWLYILQKENTLKPQDQTFYDATFASSRGTKRLQWLQNEVRARNSTNLVDIVANTTQGLSSLNRGDIDVLLSNEKSYEQALLNLSLQKDRFHTYHVRTIAGGVYFGNAFLEKNHDFLMRFNKATQACKS